MAEAIFEQFSLSFSLATNVEELRFSYEFEVEDSVEVLSFRIFAVKPSRGGTTKAEMCIM